MSVKIKSKKSTSKVDQPANPIKVKVVSTIAAQATTTEPPMDSGEFSTDELDTLMEDAGLSPPEREGGAKLKGLELEFRRKQVHRLMLRGVPRKTICDYLNMSRHTLEDDIQAINAQIKREVLVMDYPLLIGQTLTFFDEARNIALRLATDTKESSSLVKMRALDVAIKAESERHRYLNMVGLYKATSPIDIGAGDSSRSDADDFLGLIEASRRVALGSSTIVDGELSYD